MTLNEALAGDVADYQGLLAQATTTTWYAFFVQAQSDGTGNLILSRFPIVTTAGYHMKTNGTYARAIAEATIDAGGRTIDVFSLHLDNADSTIRAAQILEAIQFIGGFAGPRLVAGDLNAPPAAPELQPLLADYVDAWDAARQNGQAFAYPPDNPVDSLTRTQWTRIDYVLYADRPAAGTVATSAVVPDLRDLSNTNVVDKDGTSDDKGVRPSDHNPVVAVIQLQDVTPAVDQGPPTLAFDPPTDLFGTVTLHADAADDVAVTKVVFLLDGAPIGTVRTWPFDLVWNSAVTTLGAHTLEAVASDDAGNTTASGSVAVTAVPAPSQNGDVVVYAADATTIAGNWSAVPDTLAAGGMRLQNADLGAAKLLSPLAAPASYFDVPFTATAGIPYRLWIRGKATSDSYLNDSVYVQFSGSVTAAGAPTYRIGSTSAVSVNIEDCSGCGLSGWGWQDDGYGAGVLGPTISFAATGPQMLRVQVREDGLGIDQIVLSPATYFTSSPGALKNDMTLLSRTVAPATTAPPADPAPADAPPAVALTSPTAGSALTAPATVTLSATASDSDGTIARVEFFSGAQSLGVVTATPYTVTWTDVGAGTYSLTAVATDNAGAQTTSAAVTISVAATSTSPSGSSLPAPWNDADIGAVNLAGSATFDGVRFAVSGAGADIWNTADAFHYVYQPLQGDGEIVARVASIQNTYAWAKAGVMIRDTLDANAAFALMLVSAGKGAAFQYRVSTGAQAAGVTVAGAAAPYWVRIDRSGAAITAYTSSDGASWQQFGSVSIALHAMVYIGLAVTSHNTTELCTSTFDNVSVTVPTTPPQPPSAPANPNPTDGATNVGTAATLAWTASGATSFDVGVGLSNPPAVTTTGVLSASFAPGPLSPNTTYYWQVTAQNDVGATAGPVWSFTTGSSTTSGALPPSWTDSDIGAVGIAGSATFQNNAFTVVGAGADIWNTADAFHYAYQPLNGDGQLVARVAALQGASPWSKAGVMIRESTDANSTYAFMLVSAAKGSAFQFRAATGATAAGQSGPMSAAPLWIKITRAGNTFTGYQSDDGVNWQRVGSATVPMAVSVDIGLAVTSHNNTATATATFDNVQ